MINIVAPIKFPGVQKPFQAIESVEAAIQKSGEMCHVHPANETRRIFCRRARNRVQTLSLLLSGMYKQNWLTQITEKQLLNKIMHFFFQYVGH